LVYLITGGAGFIGSHLAERLLERGDEVIVTTVKGPKLVPIPDRFVITDYFKSEMSEYDGNYVFVSKKHYFAIGRLGA